MTTMSAWDMNNTRIRSSIEPAVGSFNPGPASAEAAQVSIAISLKRIADVLERAEQNAETAAISFIDAFTRAAR